MSAPGKSTRIRKALALAALEAGPMVVGSGRRINGNYIAVGGRVYGRSIIKRLVDEGLAMRIGRGVASCKMLREAAAALASSTVADKEKP